MNMETTLLSNSPRANAKMTQIIRGKEMEPKELFAVIVFIALYWLVALGITLTVISLVINFTQ